MRRPLVDGVTTVIWQEINRNEGSTLECGSRGLGLFIGDQGTVKPRFDHRISSKSTSFVSSWRMLPFWSVPWSRQIVAARENYSK